MTPDKRPYEAAAMWLQMRAEAMDRKTRELLFAPVERLEPLYNEWTDADECALRTAYQAWLREARLA